MLHWLVQGALAWQRKGLLPPEIVKVATADYRAESDPLAEFLEDCCDMAQGSVGRAGALFLAYEQWCGRNHLVGEDRLGSKTFFQKAQPIDDINDIVELDRS